MASPRDYKNTIVPNWCPGCGDYGIQNAISAVCAKKGWANEDITLISWHRLLLPYRRLSVLLWRPHDAWQSSSFRTGHQMC